MCVYSALFLLSFLASSGVLHSKAVKVFILKGRLYNSHNYKSEDCKSCELAIYMTNFFITGMKRANPYLWTFIPSIFSVFSYNDFFQQ
jgi:hypothetical protein